VHLATLKSGERVVVKVQRPGLKDLFDIDLKNIRWALGVPLFVVLRGNHLPVLREEGVCCGTGRELARVGQRRRAACRQGVVMVAWTYVCQHSGAYSLSAACPVLSRPSPCRALAVWLQKVDPKTDGAARDWVAIYDECSRILYQEIDCEWLTDWHKGWWLRSGVGHCSVPEMQQPDCSLWVC
jgi:hypothetical protein